MSLGPTRCYHCRQPLDHEKTNLELCRDVIEADKKIESLRAELAAERELRLKAEAHRMVERADAIRYRRLQVLGCAPFGHRGLDDGTVLRFTGLDAFLDDDLRIHPTRGEYTTQPPPAVVPASELLAKDAEILGLRAVLTEENLVETVYRWKHTWMNVKGTDERDRENYFRRAFGVDANMIHSLAKLIEKEALNTPPPAIGDVVRRLVEVVRCRSGKCLDQKGCRCDACSALADTEAERKRLGL